MRENDLHGKQMVSLLIWPKLSPIKVGFLIRFCYSKWAIPAGLISAWLAVKMEETNSKQLNYGS